MVPVRKALGSRLGTETHWGQAVQTLSRYIEGDVMETKYMSGKELQKRADKILVLATQEKWKVDELLFVMKMIIKKLEELGEEVEFTGSQKLT